MMRSWPASNAADQFWAGDAAVLGAFSPAEPSAIWDKPMVTKLSNSKSGKVGSNKGLMGWAVAPPRAFW